MVYTQRWMAKGLWHFVQRSLLLLQFPVRPEPTTCRTQMLPPSPRRSSKRRCKTSTRPRSCPTKSTPTGPSSARSWRRKHFRCSWTTSYKEWRKIGSPRLDPGLRQSKVSPDYLQNLKVEQIMLIMPFSPKESFSDSLVRTPTYEPCTRIDDTDEILRRRMDKIELTITPQKPRSVRGGPGESFSRGGSNSAQKKHSTRGIFPLLDPEKFRSKGRTDNAVFVKGRL